ncbi:hypothetical protein [Synechococcus sp. H60.4]|uniref:hypothetical protein n=1 Tax=unclassified Synechococcus TaxID=2626047 RepID=UPI0039C1800C
MRVMVADTWPGIPAAAAVAEAWQEAVERPWGLLRVDPSPSEAQLKVLWQQIADWEGERDPLLVVPGTLADPIGPGQTWADLAAAWGFKVLLTLPQEAALSQGAAFAALLHQAKTHCLGWVLLESASGSSLEEPPLVWQLQAQLGIPVLGRKTAAGQISWRAEMWDLLSATLSSSLWAPLA